MCQWSKAHFVKLKKRQIYIICTLLYLYVYSYWPINMLRPPSSASSASAMYLMPTYPTSGSEYVQESVGGVTLVSGPSCEDATLRLVFCEEQYCFCAKKKQLKTVNEWRVIKTHYPHLGSDEKIISHVLNDVVGVIFLIRPTYEQAYSQMRLWGGPQTCERFWSIVGEIDYFYQYWISRVKSTVMCLRYDESLPQQLVNMFGTTVTPRRFHRRVTQLMKCESEDSVEPEYVSSLCGGINGTTTKFLNG